MYSKELGQAIVNIASTYVGEEEIQPNQGFKNNILDVNGNQIDFQSEMINIGWEKPDPWCAALGKLVWTKAYSSYPKTLAWANNLFSLNSQQMGRNFHSDPIWATSTSIAQVGALVIFGDVGSTIAGHTEIVESVNPDGDHYSTIAGNTIPPGNPGNQAEGYIVARHTHSISAGIHSTTGLRLIRFIYPEAPID